jgi:aminopeptidase N
MPSDELGVSRELAEMRAATISDVAYAFDLTIPEERSGAVRGEVRLSFRWDDPERRPIVLDFKDPVERIERVEVNGQAGEWRPSADHVVVSPDAFQAGADNEIRVVFRAGDEALNRSDEFLYTLFVPDRAHFSLPVFDQPDLKARVTWELSVPEAWVAVANGPALDEPSPAAEGEGRHTYRFAESRPIPTYLMAFAAGRFSVETAERDGRPYHMYHRETDPDKVARNRDEIFDLVARSVAWMEEYTGIEYPFAKYDFVLIPPFQYGGMEHPGSVFYRASSLMLDESATQGALLGRASLIAHETAHMWFGDLVTMKWFDDVWTKEVFANFMAAKMVDPSFPEVNHDLRFLLAHHPRAYEVDRTSGANAIRQPLENLREAGTLYGAIIYQKAPIVMRQLELRVGEEGMRAGLREYLERFSYGNATWPDLIEILNGPTPDDLVAWSRVWVEEPGRPTMRITFDTVGGPPRPVVRQTDPRNEGRFWPQQLQLVELRGLRSRIAASLDMREPEQSFPRWAAGPIPRWVLPNGRGVEYGLFVLEDSALTRLMHDVAAIEDPVLRGSAWMVISDALLEGQASPEAVLDRALSALEVESDEQMVSLLVDLTRTTFWSLLDPEIRAAKAAVVEATLWNGLERADKATLKATWFNGWRGVISSSEGIVRLRGIWSESDTIGGLPLSENDFTALAETLAILDPDGAREVLDRQRDRIRNPDEIARFDFVRAALSPDPQERETFFADLADPRMREREPWVLDAVGYLNHPLRQDHALIFLRPGLELLGEIQQTGDIFFPGRWLEALLGGHNTPQAAEIVVGVASGSRDLGPRLMGKLLQSADGVVRSAQLVYGQGPALDRLDGLRPR